LAIFIGLAWISVTDCHRRIDPDLRLVLTKPGSRLSEKQKPAAMQQSPPPACRHHTLGTTNRTIGPKIQVIRGRPSSPVGRRLSSLPTADFSAHPIDFRECGIFATLCAVTGLEPATPTKCA
jgi:hypothetical protein